MLNWLKNKKALILVFTLVVFLCVGLFYAQPAKAEVLDTAIVAGISLVMFVLKGFIWLAGQILVLLMRLLVLVSQFNLFIDSSYVNTGWEMLRNLVNMFFILGLLFIAFSLVLNYQKVEWNKALGTLLVMAILVNFSKMICGIVIDFFQILMLTFVASYVGIAESTLFGGLGLGDIFKLNETNAPAQWQEGVVMLAGTLLGLIYLIISIIVVGFFLIQLVIRIIALWILIVFSPLAFFGYAMEGISSKLKGFFDEWSSTFFNYCVIGPCLAFFLWLSFATIIGMSNQLDAGMPDVYKTDKTDSANSAFGVGGTMEHVTKFIMSIATLVAGLSFCGRFRTIGGSMGKNAVNRAGKWTRGKLEAGARRGAGAAIAPFSAAREAGADRAYRKWGSYGRLLTERGRGELFDRSATRLRSYVSGKSLDRRELQQKQAEGMEKELKATGKYQDPRKMEQGFINAAKSKDFVKMESFMNMMASQGALNSSHRKILKDSGFMDGRFGIGKRSTEEQIAFGERLERVNEENGGGRVAMTDLRYDKNTQAFADRGDVGKEVEQYVANAGKDAFVNQANTVGFGNFGKIAGVGNVATGTEAEKDFAEQSADSQFAHALGNIRGASENQYIGNQTKEGRQRKVDALDFAMGTNEHRRSKLGLSEGEEMSPEQEVLIQDVFRYRKEGETDKQYSDAALAFYEKHDPTADDRLNNEDTLGRVDKYRASLTATYDAQGKKTKVGQGLDGATNLNSNLSSATINDVAAKGKANRLKEEEKMDRKKVKDDKMSETEFEDKWQKPYKSKKKGGDDDDEGGPPSGGGAPAPGPETPPAAPTTQLPPEMLAQLNALTGAVEKLTGVMQEQPPTAPIAPEPPVRQESDRIRNAREGWGKDRNQRWEQMKENMEGYADLSPEEEKLVLDQATAMKIEDQNTVDAIADQIDKIRDADPTKGHNMDNMVNALANAPSMASTGEATEDKPEPPKPEPPAPPPPKPEPPATPPAPAPTGAQGAESAPSGRPQVSLSEQIQNAIDQSVSVTDKSKAKTEIINKSTTIVQQAGALAGKLASKKAVSANNNDLVNVMGALSSLRNQMSSLGLLDAKRDNEMKAMLKELRRSAASNNPQAVIKKLGALKETLNKFGFKLKTD